MSSTTTKTRLNVVGQSIVRFDADEKVRGLAKYADDIKIPGLWQGHVVRSHVSHGKLKALKLDPSFDWSQVVVVTPEDIPGKNIVDMTGQDMPMIAYDEIQYIGEPVALVAAPTRALAREAGSHITAEIEELSPICTLAEVVDRYNTRPESLHEMWAQTIKKGNVDQALTEADKVVDGEYWCGHQEQMYIEPQGLTAWLEKDGTVCIEGSMQCPYYINPELCVTLDVPPERLRVRQTAVGGAFGGKEEFPTLVAGYCALLAMKSGKPVRIIYDRHEDILYTTKRHPGWVRHKTGVNNDGTIVAMKIDFLLDGGAYHTISNVVLFRGMLHASLGYRCDNVFVDGRVFRTNTFPDGAFRGFGAPQSIWGLESHIDVLAGEVGMAPHKFRLHNCLHKGDSTATGQVLNESMGSPFVLEEALKRADYAGKLKRCSHGKPGERTWYGVGLSFFGHGSGFTGDGEARIKAKAALDLEPFDDGRPGVNVRVSSTEMGQGSATVLAQAAADGLGVGIERVRTPFPDTFFVPDSGPTVASRTTMVVGSTVCGAGAKMKKALEAFAAEAFFDGKEVEMEAGMFNPPWGGQAVSFEEAARRYIEQHGKMRVYNQFDLPSTIRWNQETFEGDAYPAYSWGCNIAEVEIDTLTLEFSVKKVWAVFDIGRVINPMLAKGQLEGGLLQCLGYAVMEKMQVKNGIFDANRMQTYVIPTMVDAPEFDIHFLEYPYEHAWPGAKGVGEIPMDGLSPAIANAIKQATNVRITRIPITPEDLFDHMAAPGAHVA